MLEEFQKECIHPECFKVYKKYTYTEETGGGQGSEVRRAVTYACNLCHKYNNENSWDEWAFYKDSEEYMFNKEEHINFMKKLDEVTWEIK